MSSPVVDLPCLSCSLCSITVCHFLCYLPSTLWNPRHQCFYIFPYLLSQSWDLVSLFWPILWPAFLLPKPLWLLRSPVHYILGWPWKTVVLCPVRLGAMQLLISWNWRSRQTCLDLCLCYSQNCMPWENWLTFLNHSLSFPIWAASSFNRCQLLLVLQQRLPDASSWKGCLNCYIPEMRALAWLDPSRTPWRGTYKNKSPDSVIVPLRARS